MARSQIQTSNTPSLNNLPPQNLEAEEEILCAILTDNEILLDILDILSPDDFYKTVHTKIFAAISELFSRNEPVDLVTLANILKEKNQLCKKLPYVTWSSKKSIKLQLV